MKTEPLDKNFTDVVVIYNPNSTGSGKAMAEELQKSLKKYKVRLIGTEYAGHAEILAYKFAKATARPLVISASGDGGYHEVINGLMRAQNEGAKPTAGLLPAGNANDHYHEVHDTDLVRAITASKTQQIDLLEIKAKSNSKPFVRYAHSYIGFGLTPKAGMELNKTDLNRINEVWIVLKVLFNLKPVKLVSGGKQHKYDSLIFSNVSKMSKVMSLSKQAAPDDGEFEVTIFKRHNKRRLIQLLLKASTSGLNGTLSKESYSLRTVHKTLVQADGEVFTLDANAKVTISNEHKILRCIV